jgi:hypothetical protein
MSSRPRETTTWYSCHNHLQGYAKQARQELTQLRDKMRLFVYTSKLPESEAKQQLMSLLYPPEGDPADLRFEKPKAAEKEEEPVRYEFGEGLECEERPRKKLALILKEIYEAFQSHTVPVAHETLLEHRTRRGKCPGTATVRCSGIDGGDPGCS